MSQLFWSLRAQDDILDIAEFYGAIDPRLADDLVSRVEAAPVPLLDFPELGAVIPGREPVRKWRAANTPFVLLYIIAGDRIEVLSVAQAASDWKP